MRFGHHRKVFPRGWRGVSGHFFHFFRTRPGRSHGIFSRCFRHFRTTFFLGVGWTPDSTGPLGPLGAQGGLLYEPGHPCLL